MTEPELGGDPACWAHLLEEDEPGAEFAAGDTKTANGAMVVDLDVVATGSGGAIWSLPHGGDLDANLVRLDPDGVIGEHVNHEVDVLLVMQSGGGALTVDGLTSVLGPGRVAWIPKGASRAIAAGPAGVSYLSIHRRRDGLGITKRQRSAHD